jgi:hypothetical protein
MSYRCDSCEGRTDVQQTRYIRPNVIRTRECRACGSVFKTIEMKHSGIAVPIPAAIPAPVTMISIPDWDGIGSPPEGYPAFDDE